MPKVTINDSQGLVQSTGAGVEVSSTLSISKDTAINANFTLNGTYLTMANVTQTGMRKQIIKPGVTLTLAESGAVLIPSGSAQTFTLPTPVEGVSFKMYAGTPAAHKFQVGASGKIYGNAININDANADAAEGQKVENKSAVAFGTAFQTGDFMEVVSDGTNWFLHAVTNDPLTLTP